jgi:hypothetical protein
MAAEDPFMPRIRVAHHARADIDERQTAEAGDRAMAVVDDRDGQIEHVGRRIGKIRQRDPALR